MKQFFPPDFPDDDGLRDQPGVFLGGSIDQGVAEDWQSRITAALSDLSVNVLNPRRPNWDSTWAQDPTPGTEFHKQVAWEMRAQDHSDVIVYYFASNTISPITLLELGFYGGCDFSHIIVYCPKDFWRYGNVKMFCDHIGVDVHEDESKFILALREVLK